MVTLNLDTRDPEFANATQNREFTPLPNGEYIAQIISSERKTLQSGTDALTIAWQIIDGEYKNRQVFENLYLFDPSRPKQTAFNKQKLMFIVKACGLEVMNDTTELHNKPVKITIRTSEYNGKTRNEVTKYLPIQRITEAQPQAAQTKTAVDNEDLPF